MRTLLVIGLVASLAGCGSEPEPTPIDFSDKRTGEGVQKDLPPLAAKDLIRVCKAGSAFRVSREVKGISAKLTDNDIVRLSYTRASDGKFFRYDCKAEGNVLRFRMIDERGPGTGPGGWSGAGSTTTFKLNENSVELRDEFTDGSSDEDTLEI